MTGSTVTINGETWYRQTFEIKSYGYYFNIIFNQGSGKPQTTNIENITSDRFFEASLNGTKITYTDVTSTVGIDDVEIEPTSTSSRIYNLMGQEVKTMKKGGIYIQTRRKLKIKN
jgi:alpha-amylase